MRAERSGAHDASAPDLQLLFWTPASRGTMNRMEAAKKRTVYLIWLASALLVCAPALASSLPVSHPKTRAEVSPENRQFSIEPLAASPETASSYYDWLGEVASESSVAPVSGARLPILNPSFVPKPTTLGRVGETLAGITGNKTKIFVNGRWRIPDGLSDDVLTEVKNVANLSYSRQLRDFADFAKANAKVFELYVRPNGGTTLSGPLLDAIRNGDIILKFIPGL
jgi:hypothetical protein